MPGWSGSLPCRDTYRRPIKPIHSILLIESADEASGGYRAESTPSIVAADQAARALGTTLAEMFAEVERGSDAFNDGQR